MINYFLDGLTIKEAYFKKIEQIGSGTYGLVYIAKYVSNDQLIAIKKVKKKYIIAPL